MDRETVWIDVGRCTGCGECVEVCPTAAIALVDSKARIDEETCTGCQACVHACPEDAIQPVVHGELIPVGETPLPTTYQPRPLAQSAGAAIAVAGVGFLAKAAGALGRAVGRWLARPPISVGAPAEMGMRAPTTPPAARGGRGAGRGHRARRRHRGG